MAANETEARALLADFKPALRVMDLRLEGQLQGINIARRLTHAIDPAPKTIVVTGDTGADTLALLRASGFSWLIKPVDREHLIRTVAEELAR
jgi:DNA-binding response OmpR family regulator